MSDNRGSVFVSDAPDSRLPVQRGQAPAAPVTSGDILGAHWTLGRQDFAGAELQSEIDAYGPIVTELLKREKPGWLGITPDPYTTGARQGMPYSTGRIWDAVSRYRKDEPSFMSNVPAKNEAEFTAWVKAEELKRRRGAQDIASRQAGLGQNTLGLVADVGTGLVDPINLATMPFGGGGKTVLQVIGREALINGLTEVAELPSITTNRARFGEKMTPADMAIDVGMSTLGGAVFGAGDKLLRKGAKALVQSEPAQIAAQATKQTLQVIVPPLDPQHQMASALAKAPVSELPDTEVARRFSEAIPAEVRTPDEQAALHVIERQDDINATNPFKDTPAGRDAHADRLESAMTDIIKRGDPNGGVAIPQPIRRAALNPAPVPQGEPRTTFMERVRSRESGGNDAAVPRDPATGKRLSSAMGRYQFTDDTWLRYYKREVGAGGLSDAAILAKRTDGAMQDRLMSALTNDNAAHLHSIGAPETAGNLYLEHFAGQGGAERILKAAPDTPIENLLSADAIAANKFLRGKTAGDVIAWAHAKMGEEPHAGAVLRRDLVDNNEDWADSQAAIDAEARDLARSRQAEAAGPARIESAIDPAVEPRSFNIDPGEHPVVAALRDTPDVRYIKARDAYEAATPSRQAITLDEGRAHAEEFVGKPLQNASTGMEATVSKSSLRKMLSQSAVGKSTSPGEHALAVANADRLFAAALLDETHPNARDLSAGAGVIAVHRYVAPLVTPEGVRAVKMTVKETAGKAPNPLYTIETMEVEPDRLAPQSGIEPVPGQGLHTGRPGSNPEVRSMIESVKDMHDHLDAVAGHYADAPVHAAEHLPAFDKPTDKGPAAQVESVMHDLRLAAEAEPDASFRVGEEGTERPLSEILKDLDDEDAAIEAVRGCL